MRFHIERKRRFLIFCLAVFGIIGLIFFRFIWGGGTVLKNGQITIAAGAKAPAVWQSLVAKGFTRRTLPWRYAAFRQGIGSGLKAGTYNLEKGEVVAAVIKRFEAGDVVPTTLTVTYPEGFTLEQIAARTADRGLGNKEDFIAATQIKNFVGSYTILADAPPSRNLEGYLFPDTYQLAKDDSPTDIIKRFLGNLERRFTPEMRQEAKAKGRTLDQIMIMASIVEREAVTTEDMNVIAGILWKRFDAGAGLAADATLRYGLKRWDTPLTVQDLATDSAYNTRKYRGLPPGPICNPGLRAILAAINPQSSDYYYYLTTADGHTYFAKTNDEHNGNKAKYLR